MKLPLLILTHLYFLLLSDLLLCNTLASRNPHIVYLGGHSFSHEQQVKESHYELLGSFLGSHDDAKEAIFYSYTRHINGFAAMLEDEDATELAKHPNVVSVFLSRGRKLHTTHSWSFLGLEKHGEIPSHSLWKKAKFGEDTIIANLDTGAWPESESFSDEGMGPIPPRWKGICQNQNDSMPGAVHCNRKLIGAKYFNKAYLKALAAYNASAVDTVLNTSRDDDGHGTHTLSTAAGNFVKGVSVFNFGKGTAKGGSPRARVAAYKVCWTPINGNECYDADILAAFDAAISDGVDVISVSLGGNPAEYFLDSVAIGSFHAMMRGIPVVCSAGNSGPADGSVTNVAPWLLTVGASTTDRDFANYVVLGNGKRVQGQSLAPKRLPPGKFFPLMSAADAKAANATIQNATLCADGSLDPEKARGKILVCLRGITARVAKGEQCALAGAVGMVLANDPSTGNEVIADAHVLPASHVNYSNGVLIYSYINSTRSPKAYITYTVTELGIKPAPFMAAFSSRGPNTITPEILKPDITAPGVSVIAAYTEVQGPTDQPFDKRRVKFNSLSGTSMSCPHVSGIIGLLRTLYPHWSPAAIKSAIMTTAVTRDNVREPILNASNFRADRFSYGAGHVHPARGMDPGLVYDLGVNDYLNFLCALGYNQTAIESFVGHSYACPKDFSVMNLNYPSITVPNLNGSITVTRTVKNVGSPGVYNAYVQRPAGIKVSVKPKRLEFDHVGQEKSFSVALKVRHARAAGNYAFGLLRWSDGKHQVRSPIIVKAV
ncbi:Subtilisin-like protease SBT5.3 [Ancistrocladus abbreviatus]